MDPMNQHALDNTRLYEASINGDVDALNDLIREDRLVLTRITPTFFRENPLHIAALHGHSSYAKELLRHRSSLAEEVDAWGHTALHLASAKGYAETVRVLVQADCGGCLKRNSEGRLPLHLAIMKRHVEVVRELVRASPGAAREVVDRGQNAAHLCVRGNYLEGLRAIVEELHGDEEFLASRDEDGNTILHLAVAVKSLKIVEYIVPLIVGQDMANARNKRGVTALDMAENNIPRDLEELQLTNLIINAGIPSCRGGGARGQLLQRTSSRLPISNIQQTRIKGRIRSWIDKFVKNLLHFDKKWIETMNQSLIIVAILVATVAFQAGLQPPGGVWPIQTVDSNDNITVYPAGSAMAARGGDFFTFNTLAFLSSLSVILLLVSGAPLHNKCCVWVLVLFVWATLTFMTLTYSAAMLVVDAEPVYNITELYQEINVSSTGFGDYLYLSIQPAAYSSTLLMWFFVLGGVILYHLLVVVVWLARLLYRFFHRR